MTGIDDPYEPPLTPELTLTPAPLADQVAAGAGRPLPILTTLRGRWTRRQLAQNRDRGAFAPPAWGYRDTQVVMSRRPPMWLWIVLLVIAGPRCRCARHVARADDDAAASSR